MCTNSPTEAPEVLSLSELKVNLPQDVYSHLSQQYDGNGGTDDGSHPEKILECMKISPGETCCRVNLLQSSVEKVIDALNTHLSRSTNGDDDVQYTVRKHETIRDVVTIRSCSTSNKRDDLFYRNVPPPIADASHAFSSWENRRKKGWPMNHRAVIVDRFCGEAVLRGAHVFVKGILGADAGIQEGEEIAVYAHLSSNKPIPRGLLQENYTGKCVFLGMGKSICKRSDYFAQSTGKGITMTRLAGPSLPPLNGVLVGKIMLQNLPSAIVVHALNPQRGEVILDMCSAPGGKTSHVASLIGNDGLVIACDKGRKKMSQAREFFLSMGATCIIPIATDSTKLLLDENANRNRLSPRQLVEAAAANVQSKDEQQLLKIKGFYPDSFDSILLDPPCSALGLRPKLQVEIKSADELQKHAEYQKQFVKCAVPLLKSGGIMTYSTCTINASENEKIVRFILTEFPCMMLVPISDNLPGLPALPGFGLSDEERKMIRRFDPSDRDIDSMGFFIAKFQKM